MCSCGGASAAPPRRHTSIAAVEPSCAATPCKPGPVHQTHTTLVSFLSPPTPLTSSHLLSPPLTSSHLLSPPLTSSPLLSPPLTSSHLPLTSHSSHLLSPPLTSFPPLSPLPQELAARGATTYMVCRHPGRGQEAVERVRAATGNKDVHLQVSGWSGGGGGGGFGRVGGWQGGRVGGWEGWRVGEWVGGRERVGVVGGWEGGCVDGRVGGREGGRVGGWEGGWRVWESACMWQARAVCSLPACFTVSGRPGRRLGCGVGVGREYRMTRR